MRLKKTTEKSSDQLRGIATAVFVVGLIIGVTLITLGMMSIMQAKEQDSYKYARSFMEFIFNLSGTASIFFGGIIFFWHYVIYVMISAYATIVENSDRSDVVEAILTISDSLDYNSGRGGSAEELLEMLNSCTSRMDSLDDDYDEDKQETGEEEDDVELEKIDITNIEE